MAQRNRSNAHQSADGARRVAEKWPAICRDDDANLILEMCKAVVWYTTDIGIDTLEIRRKTPLHGMTEHELDLLSEMQNNTFARLHRKMRGKRPHQI